jgi:hypothetical protein
MIAANENEDLWKYYDLSAATPSKIVLLPLPATAQDVRSDTPDIAGLTEEEYGKFRLDCILGSGNPGWVWVPSPNG